MTDVELMQPRPVRERVAGAPFQPGDLVRVVRAIDKEVLDLSEYVGRSGVVEYLEYSCGSGQHYPDDPMIGVRLGEAECPATGARLEEVVVEFWRDEIQGEGGA